MQFEATVAGQQRRFKAGLLHDVLSAELRHPHSRYGEFVDFGDGEAYRGELQALRQALSDLDQERT